MKNFKEYRINESIDRYEFGFINPDNIDGSLTGMIELFDISNYSYIRENLKNKNNYSVNYNIWSVEITQQHSNDLLNYTIQNLGDYVFILFVNYNGYSNNENTVEIIDGIEEVVNRLNEYTDNQEVLNETFDKYDFKTYQGSDIDYLYDDFRESAMTFDPDNVELISELFSEYKIRCDYSSNGKPYMCSAIFRRNDKLKNAYVIIHYLDDYIFAISMIDQFNDNLYKAYVCDGIDELICVLKDELQKR